MFRRDILKTGLLAPLGLLIHKPTFASDSKLEGIFKRTDEALCKTFQEKTNNLIYTLHGCGRNERHYNSPVFSDYYFNPTKYSVHSYIDLNNHISDCIVKAYIDTDESIVIQPVNRLGINDGVALGLLGASYDEEKQGISLEEYEIILKMFADKYRVTPLPESKTSA